MDFEIILYLLLLRNVQLKTLLAIGGRDFGPAP